MELRQYLGILRKWAWLIVLTTAIAAGSSYFYSREIPRTYRAETTLLVGQALKNSLPSATDPYYQPDTSSYAQAYALLAIQPPILQATADAIQWPGQWQDLYYKVTAAVAQGSQLLIISVTDNDPKVAKSISDEITHQLILQGPISEQQKQAEDQRAFVTTQLTQLKLQIETNQKTLTNLTNQAALETNAAKLSDLSARIGALQSKIDNWQTNYANLSSVLNNSSSLFLTVLAPAQEPTTPVSPNVTQNILFAAIAGLVISGAAILLLEYLDDTVKDADDAQRVVKSPAIGAITRIANVQDLSDSLITVKHPRSPIAEAYRVLRTNLRFTGIENPSGALLVTSAGPGEGKTTTAANLAVTLAQAGRRVILLDTDLRRPTLHKVFGLSNDIGLSSLFLGDAPSLEGILQPTAIEGLSVITSGPIPPNPAEVLDSKQMNSILDSLRAQADMLILDSPPVLAVADASILGSRCSGALLVVDSGRTRSDVCRRAVETLNKTKVKVYGVVLNRLAQRRAAGYYHYYYYSTDEKKTHQNGRRNGHEAAA